MKAPGTTAVPHAVVDETLGVSVMGPRPGRAPNASPVHCSRRSQPDGWAPIDFGCELGQQLFEGIDALDEWHSRERIVGRARWSRVVQRPEKIAKLVGHHC